MPWLPSLILRLYPREWRRRYGNEMQAMLDEQRFTVRMATDLMAGAIDARLNPQTMPDMASAPQEDSKMTTRMFRCAPTHISREDQVRSGAWMLGGSAVLAAVALLLQHRIGSNTFSEALLYAAFPAALMLSSECTYFKPYSRAARITLALGGAALIVLFMWLSVELAYRI